MTTSSGGPPLTAARLIAYALPTLALQSMMVPLLLYLPPAYASVTVGMALSTVAAMFLVGRIFELVSDPLIGALSDRSRSRFGRRRLWMAIGTPIAMLAGWFLVAPPAGVTGLYLGGWLILFYLGWTMVYIPHQSWGGEITNDYEERTRIAGYRETGTFVGYLLASLAPLVYWKLVMGVEAPSFEQIVQVVGIFFLIALPIGVLCCFLLVPPSAVESDHKPLSWRELYSILVRNRPFLRLGSSYLFDRLAMGTYFAAQPFFVGMVLDLQKDILTVAITNTVVAAALAPLWVGIAKRLGKHRTYVLANAITAASYLLLFFVPVGALGLVMVAQVLMGFGNCGTMITPPAMTADTVDHDELQSGARQMGGHMAFLAIVYKGGIMLGAPLTLGLIAVFGFEGGTGVLDDPAAMGIRICASLLPAVMLLLPMIVMWRFPIDAARHAEIRAALDQRRAA